MFKKKLYFNGTYLVYGRVILGKIRGHVIDSKANAFKTNSRVSFKVDTFIEVDKEKLKRLKDFGYLPQNLSNLE